MVKGSGSHNFNHPTFDHVFWPAEVIQNQIDLRESQLQMQGHQQMS